MADAGLGVAAGHPNREGEESEREGGKRGEERDLRKREGREEIGPLSGQWQPPAVVAAGVANRERGIKREGGEKRLGGGCCPSTPRTGASLWPRPAAGDAPAALGPHRGAGGGRRWAVVGASGREKEKKKKKTEKEKEKE